MKESKTVEREELLSYGKQMKPMQTGQNLCLHSSSSKSLQELAQLSQVSVYKQ
jgi:hypothetical protein